MIHSTKTSGKQEMSQWLSAKRYNDFSAVAHTDGPAFTHSNNHTIDFILITDKPTADTPNEVQDFFDSFIGKTVKEWLE